MTGTLRLRSIAAALALVASSTLASANLRWTSVPSPCPCRSSQKSRMTFQPPKSRLGGTLRLRGTTPLDQSGSGRGPFAVPPGGRQGLPTMLPRVWPSRRGACCWGREPRQCALAPRGDGRFRHRLFSGKPQCNPESLPINRDAPICHLIESLRATGE
jgi:hypothetical protein